MSDLYNPYQSPETQIEPEEKQKSGVELTVNMLKYLIEASPWLIFIGILGYIMTALTVIGGVIASIGLFAASNQMDFSAGFGAIFTAFYLPIGALMFIPSHFTFKFGQKIRSYKFTNSVLDIEQALKNNKSLWKFLGILLIVYLSLIPVLIVVSIIVGVAGVLGVY